MKAIELKTSLSVDWTIYCFPLLWPETIKKKKKKETAYSKRFMYFIVSFKLRLVLKACFTG